MALVLLAGSVVGYVVWERNQGVHAGDSYRVVLTRMGANKRTLSTSTDGPGLVDSQPSTATAQCPASSMSIRLTDAPPRSWRTLDGRSDSRETRADCPT